MPNPITADELLAIMQGSGLPTALRDRGLLESALGAPFAGFGDFEAYPNPFEKSAVLMRSLIGNHPFVDGNKRAGLFAALLLLRISGYDFDAPDNLVYEETIAVASGQRSIEHIATFLARYARPF
jgi:death-on-curing protein